MATDVLRETTLNTDESRLYTKIGTEFAAHHTVNHGAEEYVRGDAYTNTVEGVFSVFKRGMRGTYQHCGEKHLHRYLAEFYFRYKNRVALGVNDVERAENMLLSVVGKRLTYQDLTNGAKRYGRKAKTEAQRKSERRRAVSAVYRGCALARNRRQRPTIREGGRDTAACQKTKTSRVTSARFVFEGKTRG